MESFFSASTGGDWDEYFQDRTFTGRLQELEQLQRALLTPSSRAVAIVGGYGMGKTALAMAFGNQQKANFSAGVYHIYATQLESLQTTVNAHVSNPTNPYLLILDELQLRPMQDLDVEIIALRKARPSARLICISTETIPNGAVDLTLNLYGLSLMEFQQLLAKHGRSPQDLDLEQGIFSAVAGNPRSIGFVASALAEGNFSPRQILMYLRGFSYSGLIDSNGIEIARGTPVEKQIIVDTRIVNDRLLDRIYRNPNILYEITPRRFEEFIAELLTRLGYTVDLTPPSKDGGKDIYAAKKDNLGSFLYVVECKQYSPTNRVGVGLIRQLHGVVQAEKATAGILATTSFFTRDAKEFQERVPYQLSLQDYFGIQSWLNKALTKPSKG